MPERAAHLPPAAARPAHQDAVRQVVSRSHATIPAAFAAVRVDAAELVRGQRRISVRARMFIGVPELVIWAVARLRSRFPQCFSPARAGPDTRVDLGVTIDVGNGLSVVVIRDAGRLDVPEISARLMDFRTRAVRGALREADFTDPHLTVSLHMEPGIVLARPIVAPGQVCTLALCPVHRELHLAPSGMVEPRDYFQLGLAYDHRALNGGTAGAFLTSLRDRLEAPGAPD